MLGIKGKLGEKEVYALEGRFHFYEGYSMKEVCYPFYVLKLLGVEQVVLTNACGGINREFAPGTLMLLTDFINMMGTNPLIGPNCVISPNRPPTSWAFPIKRAFIWASWAPATRQRPRFAPLRAWVPMLWA